MRFLFWWLAFLFFCFCAQSQNRINLPFLYSQPSSFSNGYVQLSAQNYFQTELNSFEVDFLYNSKHIDYHVGGQFITAQNYLQQVFKPGFTLLNQKSNLHFGLSVEQSKFANDVKEVAQYHLDWNQLFKVHPKLTLGFFEKIGQVNEVEMLFIGQLDEHFKFFAKAKKQWSNGIQVGNGFQWNVNQHNLGVFMDYQPFQLVYFYGYRSGSWTAQFQIQQFTSLGYISKFRLTYAW